MNNTEPQSTKEQDIHPVPIENPPDQKPTTSLPQPIIDAIHKWGNAIPSVPTNLLTKSTVTAIVSERAKVLTAQFLYGERNGRLTEIPYDGGGLINGIGVISEESLWLHNIRGHDGLVEAPSDFSEKILASFFIPIGRKRTCPECDGDRKKTCPKCDGFTSITCPKCDGDGKKDCGFCKGDGWRDGHKCSSCNGKGKKPCDRCNSRGKLKCEKCDGRGEVKCKTCDGKGEVKEVLEVMTNRFNVKSSTQSDYHGEVPDSEIKAATGTSVFKETCDYPKDDRMKEMLKGGIDQQEYIKLQTGVANIFHSHIDGKLRNYDGDINLVHDLVDNFFEQIPNAGQENRVLEHEIVPVRMEIKVEDIPVKKVSYKYKDKAYDVWVYGTDSKVYAKEQPFAVTGRLAIRWFFKMVVGALIVWGIWGIATISAKSPDDVAPTFFSIIFVTFLYFLPAFIAHKKQHAKAIFIWNLFFGWFPLTWLGFLIWAIADKKKDKKDTVAK